MKKFKSLREETHLDEAFGMFATAVAAGAAATYGPGLLSKASSKIGSAVGEGGVKGFLKKVGKNVGDD